MIFLEKERLRLQPSASPLRAESRFKEVSGQLAPWAIRPGQLAPDLQTTSSSFFYPIPSQTSR